MYHLEDEIEKKAKYFREEYPTITVFESLKLAADIQRNQLFAKANVLSPDDKYPSALEAIAISTGFTPGGFSGGYLENIADNISELKDTMSESMDK